MEDRKEEEKRKAVRGYVNNSSTPRNRVINRVINSCLSLGLLTL